MKKSAFILAGIVVLSAATVTTLTYANNSSATDGSGDRATFGRGMGHGSRGMMGSGSEMRPPFGSGFGMGSGCEMRGPMGSGFQMGSGHGMHLEMGGRGKFGIMGNSGVQSAITTNNYTSFVAAIKGTPMEGKVTEAQFTHMVSGEKRRTAIETALKNNDYAAFVEANKVSETEFADMVKMHKERPEQPNQN